MSLFGAMTSGVSGLAAQSSAMGAIADNITNVNTVGYKNTKTDFQSLVTKQTSTTYYSAGGVQARPLQQNDVQGLLQATSSSTDIAVSGNGMFLVNEASQPSLNSEFLFTRAGSFYQDEQGYLRNAAGFYLQGWPTDAQGNTVLPPGSNAGATNQNIISTDFLETVNLSRIGSTAAATTNIGMGANLPASAPADGTAMHKIDVQIYDTLGTSNAISMGFTKTATNEWDLAVNPPTGTSVLNLRDEAGDIYQSIGQLEFKDTPTGGFVTIGGTDYTFGAGAGFDIDTSVYGTTPAAVGQLATLLNTSNAAFTGGAFTASADGGTLRLSGNNNGGTNTLSVYSTGTEGFLVQRNGAADPFTVNQPTVNAPAIQFDSDGLPQSFGVASMELLDFVNGASNLDGGNSSLVSLDFGTTGESNGMTQFADDFAPGFIQQDGARFGTYAGVTISEDGLMTARFDNGELRPIFRLPLATFTNPNGLEARSGNVWHATDASGQATLRAADNGPAGQIMQASLESSTVDIGEEFADMIMVQRAYSAATKIISTADEMLEELVRIKR